MPNFVWLRQGDKLPAVAAAQALLNRTGASLAVDGNFGPRTKAAVIAFQRPRGLSPDGVIGQNTWPRLKNTETLPIVDCIDVFDPDLYTSERRFLRNVGGEPIVVGGMSNGIEQVVSEVLRRHSSIYLLRFHGHGNKGIAGASFGHGSGADVWDTRSHWEDSPECAAALRKLRSHFGGYGCIQFMHCQTGGGLAGSRFLSMVARETGVPATAAIHDQYASTLRETLRFEGPAKTMCPGAASLATWARGRRPFAGMSVM